MRPWERTAGENVRPRRGDRRPHAADPDADGGQDSGDAQPQIVKCPVPVLQEMVQEVVPEADRATVYEDDLEEGTLQAGAELVEKEMINEAYTLLSIAMTARHRGSSRTLTLRSKTKVLLQCVKISWTRVMRRFLWDRRRATTPAT